MSAQEDVWVHLQAGLTWATEARRYVHHGGNPGRRAAATAAGRLSRAAIAATLQHPHELDHERLGSLWALVGVLVTAFSDGVSESERMRLGAELAARIDDVHRWGAP